MVISGSVIRTVPGGTVLSQSFSVCPKTIAFGDKIKHLTIAKSVLRLHTAQYLKDSKPLPKIQRIIHACGIRTVGHR